MKQADVLGMMQGFLKAFDAKEIDLNSLVQNIQNQVNYEEGTVMIGYEDDKLLLDIIEGEDNVLRRIEITQEQYDYFRNELEVEEF